MATFQFASAHDHDNPPRGSIDGTLVGKQGAYEVQLVVSGTGKLFAGPVDVTLGPSGKAPVSAPIKDCGSGTELMNVTLRSQVRTGAGPWQDSFSRNVNYRCS